MKVLMTSSYNSRNSYVKSIVDSLRSYCEVVCCSNTFWNSNLCFDIIHIQWPEELFNWNISHSQELKLFELKIAEWKKKGTKIVITRHNVIPHKKSSLGKDLYDLVFRAADGVIHLGEYSLLNLSISSSKNIIIDHPSYLNVYKYVDKSVAQKSLSLPNGNIFLSVGSIRKKSELNFLIKSFLNNKKFTHNDYLVICGTQNPENIPSFRKTPIKRLVWEFLKFYRKYYYKMKNIIFAESNISPEKLNLYMNAADVVVVPRLDTLNSGVVFLALTYKKPVVGPRIGNITEVLLKTQNFCFEPGNETELEDAMKMAFEHKEKIAQESESYIQKSCNPLDVAKRHFDFYKSL